MVTPPTNQRVWREHVTQVALCQISCAVQLLFLLPLSFIADKGLVRSVCDGVIDPGCHSTHESAREWRVTLLVPA